MFHVGIEHEFVFADAAGRYLDADNTGYSVFGDIVANFPVFEGDDGCLDCKSLETFPKRCYVEGLERHDRNGALIETLPKGLEIRTLPQPSVDAAIAEFRHSFGEAVRLSQDAGLSPVLTSRHPFKSSLALYSRLGAQERQVRSEERLALAMRSMLSHGLHVNVSLDDWSRERMADRVAKVNYYTPALIPWSFSSPFFEGRAFDGLCCRNFFRAETRQMAELIDRRGVAVLEFRGFDACGDADLLDALLRLFCGFLLEDQLPGRSSQQDPERLRLSSIRGFEDPSIRSEAREILEAARLAGTGNDARFDRLEEMLEKNDSYAARMRRRHGEGAGIMECISGQYHY